MKILQLVLFYFLCAQFTFAQDPHFSQYFASPLIVNPASTGFFDGDYRISTNIRQQWANVGDGYYTSNLSADFKLSQNSIQEIDKLAIGILGLNDQSLNGALNNSYYAISLGFHKGLSYQGNQSLGVGLQVGLIQKSLDYSRLTFANQFNGREFDLTIPSGTQYDKVNINNFDFNFGLLYDINFDKWGTYLGTSIYHITQPNESVFSSIASKLPFRNTIHGGGNFILNNTLSFVFSGNYNKQANTEETLYGGLLKISSANNNFNFYTGVWNRINDAIIPYFGIDYNQWSAGINYSVSSNIISNYRPRTFELSFIFRKNSDTDSYNRCPRF
jgi:type IX secretion system PorP/SprF family membrane protein